MECTEELKIEDKIVRHLEIIFGMMAKPTVERQKEKLGLKRELSEKDYLMLAKGIYEVCAVMVGETRAQKVYNDLMEIIKSNFSNR